ncbi:MAG: hypothetical protein ACOYOI_09910, partial [Chthoniobacterales bacterium]
TSEYDAQQAPTITLEPIMPIGNGLTYEELQADPILAESEPMRFRCQGTLFALTQVEADHLRSLGCQYAQGYLYGKAMTLEELTTLIGSQ